MREKLLNLFFLPRCAICGEILAIEERKDFLCKTCRKAVPYVTGTKCPHCGGETDTAGFCRSCLREFPFTAVCAAFPYGEVREAIHLFKYGGDKNIGHGLGELMAVYLLREHEELLQRADLMAAVPLYPKKESYRGFNQAHILCEKIAERTGLVFRKDILERKRETIAQSELNPEERKINLQNAFAVTADVEGKRILLVDDIFTTGTTCRECAKELYRAGAVEVMVFALSAAGTK